MAICFGTALQKFAYNKLTSEQVLTYNIKLYEKFCNELWDKYFLPNERSLVCSSVIVFLHPGNDWLIFFIDFFLQIEQFLYLFQSLQSAQGGMY